ncbi:MAG: hypothetical protein COA78_21350 [Blastopirellula sp.]|nr:MAG: hypothetical protein COA78_21350 [Blastopirellula sp.]
MNSIENDLFEIEEQDQEEFSIRLEGVLRDEDYEKAQKLQWSGSRVFQYIAVVFGVLVALIAIDTLAHDPNAQALEMTLDIVSIAIGLLVFVFIALIKPQEKSEKKLEEHLSLLITKDGLFGDYIQTSTSFLPWENVLRASRHEDLVTLYASTKQTVLTPRRLFLDDNQWRDFLRILNKYAF